MLTVAVPKRNKLQNIIVLTPKDGDDNIKKFDLIYCIFFAIIVYY